MAKILYKNISELVTNTGVVKKQGVGVVEEDLGIIYDAALLWDEKKGIFWLGKNSGIPKSLAKGAKSVSLKGKILCPALVDCHTHLVFAGDRHQELAKRLSGATYQEIAAAGGGIVTTVSATRAASEKDLLAVARERVKTAISLGVGILEIKSGYGLDLETELKQLKVVAKLKKEFKSKITILATFMGAHAFPKELKTPADRNSYVDNIVDNMLPRVAKLKLADTCDVFFDEGYFDYAQSKKILTTAKKLGLKIKLHADELADTGGAALAAELGALSADHLLKANDHGLAAMAKAGVVAVLLPTTALYLQIPYASVEKMRKAKVCMALSTDFNPGSSPTQHLPFAMSLACFAMGMTMAEAFAATTFGGAKAVGLQKDEGFLAIGKKPRMSIFNFNSYHALIAHFAHPNPLGLDTKSNHVVRYL